MLDFPRWKILWIWAIIGTLVALSIPSFLPSRLTAGTPIARLPSIAFGLDLAGGSYLLLEADVEDVRKQRVDQMRETVVTEMRRNQPRISIGEISTQNGRLSFMLRDPSQVDAARERINGFTSGAGMTGQRDWDIQVVDGSRFVLTPTDAGLKLAVNRAMDDTTDNVRKRIDALGTREPTIIRQGDSRIIVQVPGLQDPQQLKELLGKTAKLEFKLVDTTADPAAVARGQAPVGSQILPYAQGGAPIAVKRNALITGSELIDARQEYEQQTNAPNVAITFNGAGGRKFALATQQNTGKPFAIIVDNQVISAPNINEPILGGRASIAGGFTVESANQLAIALRSGQLAVPVKVIEESTVSAELGQDSIRAGVLASIVAVLAVAIFLLVTYGRFGVYANLAVVINVLVIIAVMAMFKASLTLPGIAGFVLTIGTAVDANVLINERIREERRRGRNVVTSVELGYKEASRTIFEANVQHAITGIIMLVLGSGPVKGFAVVLLIGICTSVFTAVVFTRMLVALWLRKHRPTDINI